MEAATSAASVFELKSGRFTLPNLRLFHTDMNQFADQLEKQVNMAPAFFQNTPVVIDLGQLSGQSTDVDFALLVGLMRGQGMVPIGIRGGTPRQQELAELMELAILSEQHNNERSKPTATKATADKKTAGHAAVAQKPQGSKLVTRPVRSGQRIYAAGGDLVITAQVSSGAEVIADGNIHVYGTLRGRALAGVKGNRHARVFCHNLQAELISIAGHYRVNEALKEEQMNRPVQISLSGKKLEIQPL
ncbi:MAG: septum site-determining protein MinC [Gammaproteobacteria bacterium]|nr:septum site-determining protein MinC [Gammaproteobacteria bacterium]